VLLPLLPLRLIPQDVPSHRDHKGCSADLSGGGTDPRVAASARTTLLSGERFVSRTASAILERFRVPHFRNAVIKGGTRGRVSVATQNRGRACECARALDGGKISEPVVSTSRNENSSAPPFSSPVFLLSLSLSLSLSASLSSFFPARAQTCSRSGRSRKRFITGTGVDNQKIFGAYPRPGKAICEELPARRRSAASESRREPRDPAP